MDKYEYNTKIEQIRQAVDRRDIKEAIRIADEIDWKRERDTKLLIMVAGAYEVGKQYHKAKEILLMAYEKAQSPQSGRQLAYRLSLISAKTKEFDEAIEFYHDFVEMAPRDTARYVLQYRIAKAKGEPISYLIEILEEYVDIDMEEKWMYELAKLYHAAGEEEKCVEICDEMSLWFSHGDYVRSALDLKMKYKPLTKRQMENYHKTEEQILKELKEKKALEETANLYEYNNQTQMADNGATIPFTTMKAAEFHNSDEQDESYDYEDVEDIEDVQIAQVGESQGFVNQEVANHESANQFGAPKFDTSVFGPIDTDNTPTKVIETPVGPEQDAQSLVEEQSIKDTVPIPGEINIEDIHVKQFEGDGSDTIDIQAVIAQNIQEIMADEEVKEEPQTQDKEDLGNITLTLDPLYKYEDHGQIGLDIPEPKKEDKQITGQLSIEDVLRNLEERGILKADTVNKAVETMDQAAEAVDQAAEEAAIIAENEKKNQTIVEELDLSALSDESDMADVKSALESYADDAAQGFVFTDEIDSAAIEKALQDSEEMIMPEANTKEVALQGKDAVTPVDTFSEVPNANEEIVATVLPAASLMEKTEDVLTESEINSLEAAILQETQIEENEVEDLLKYAEEGEEQETPEENKIELATGVPVLDLSFATPVKKLQPGLAPTNTAVPANTASLQEMFADLDEATKRDIGIFEERESVVPEKAEEIISAQEQNDNDFENKEGVVLPDLEESNVNQAQGVTEENVTQTVAKENQADSTEENVAQATTEEMVARNVTENIAENATENTTVEATDNASEEAASEVTNESNATQTESAEDLASAVIAEMAKNVDMQESVAEQEPQEAPKKKLSRAGEMPIVTISTNKNLTQTQSLDLDKIIITDEELLPFESFKTVNGLEQKIVDTVITLAASYQGLGTSKNGNIMILGDDKSGKTTMAIELIKLINKKRERGGRRIAKVDSTVLNTRGIRSSMKKLIGSDLIVENAQHLRKSVLSEFISIGQYYTDDMLIVFEGETSALKTMRNENDDIAKMFDHVLVIKEYDVKEWVAYAKKYASTKNYMIDEMGTLALYKAIDDFYGKHQGINQVDVESIINRAIKKASGKVGRKLTNLFSGKNDDSGMDILKEVDFK